jgi:hypothetical protein
VSALISPRALVRVIAHKQTRLLERFESDDAFERHTLDRSSVQLSRTDDISAFPAVGAFLRSFSVFTATFCVFCFSMILTVMTFSSAVHRECIHERERCVLRRDAVVYEFFLSRTEKRLSRRPCTWSSARSRVRN